METWNWTVHSNSLYLELLASVGVVGIVPFLAWLAMLLRDIVLAARQRLTLEQVALATAIFAFLLHGVLDYFLLFNGTGLLFWALIGAWFALRKPATAGAA